MNLNDILIIASIIGIICGWFYTLVIHPFKESIHSLEKAIMELRNEIEKSINDRRGLDTRISTIEEAMTTIKDRVKGLEDIWKSLSK